jgi:hypothetical protein
LKVLESQPAAKTQARKRIQKLVAVTVLSLKTPREACRNTCPQSKVVIPMNTPVRLPTSRYGVTPAHARASAPIIAIG